MSTEPVRVGLMVGREWSFPPAFIDEVARRDAGVVAEYVKLGAPRMDEPVSLARDHRPHLPRGAVLPLLPEARGAAGHDGRQQPVHVDGRRQVLRRRARHVARHRASQDGGAAQQGVRAGHQARREPAQPRVPARLGRDRGAHRAAVRAQGRPRRRLARRLRLQDDGRADPRLRPVGPAHHGAAGVRPLGPVHPLHVPRASRTSCR